MNAPSIREIRDASQRITSFIHRTPVLTCSTLNRMCSTELFFKCENFQKAGAFKTRGAANAVFSLEDARAARGVATHSSGNHAAALALAASWRNIPAYVVMPTNASQAKKDATAGYGAEITLCDPTLAAREQGLAEVVERTGAAFIPPYNDFRVISGQGTAALELIEEVGNLDIVMAPVGGGGLLSGTAIAVSALAPKTRVIGAEPKEADDAAQSFYAGRIIPAHNPRTIADGLRTSLGDRTFPIIKALVADIVTVSEEAIVEAMRIVWERMKILIEPSAAVPVGAVLTKGAELPGTRIGIILSGGNVDLASLPFSKDTM
ncbi:MAG: pyridoxal-phosphate dependent enzyme [Thermodesulfobacteriota bacterium]